MIRALPDRLESPRVIVYHQCSIAATGSILGPHDALAYWWADGAGVRIVPAGPIDGEARRVLEQAVMEALGGHVAGNAARRHQDELAETPDL